MKKEIIIRSESDETLVAVMEDGRLAEMYMDRADSQRLTGNIYKGVVENILPGMQAAFVDIGLAKNSFLYIREAIPQNVPHEDSMEFDVEITDVLKRNQEILVQIVKDPVASKGARVTTHLTLAGRFLVLMPTVEYVGISRRIEDETERERLFNMVEELCPDGMGIIVRTVAVGATIDEFKSDLNNLISLWGRIQKKVQESSSSKLIYRDLDLLGSMIRDVMTDDVDKIIVNDEVSYNGVMDCLNFCGPDYKNRVAIEDMTMVFEKYSIPDEIKKASKRRAWLKSGGYIIIDNTEALTTIDVNTGKYVGTTNLSDTVLKTNLEAVEEIATQIRLRNIGGIIIIDFIDMDKSTDNSKVIDALEIELKKDRIKTNILGFTQLGLLEMTRKKVGHGIHQMMDGECRYCDGRGRHYSCAMIAMMIRHEVEKLARITEARGIMVEADAKIVKHIIDNKLCKRWGKECGKKIRCVEGIMPIEDYTVRPDFE